MAFGDCADDKALKDAWGSFCDKLKEAGDRVFKEYNPATPLHRADGFRFLTQNLGQAFDLGFETKDTRYPKLHFFTTPTMKLGADAADLTYLQAWLDGNSVYRISGNRGTCRFINFAIQGPRSAAAYGAGASRPLHEPFGDVPEANMFGQQLKCAWDGSFELYIGGPQRGPNWLPTTPGTRKLFLRQGFDSWDERPASMQIERIDMAEPKPLPLPKDTIAGMEWAGNFLSQMMIDWPDLSIENAGGKDAVPVNAFPQQVLSESDKKRGRAAASMNWAMAPDEAMVIEFESHDGFWMLGNMGAFRTSMDFLYRPVSYTPARAKADSDGKMRFVMCDSDPGYFNWMDTQGFVEGSIVYRNFLSTNSVNLVTKLVKRADIAAAMRPDSAKCSKEERVAEMWRRFHGIRRRYNMA